MKAVLDTNVFISGAFWPGPSRDIIKLAEQGKVRVYSSPEIMKELVGVLQREKFAHLFKEGQTSLSDVLRHLASIADVRQTSVQVDVIREDPDDNKFLACALSVQADFIVSGDKHLLTLREFKAIPILSPRQFLGRLNPPKAVS